VLAHRESRYQMSERVIAKGTIGSTVWMITTTRLIVTHADRIPAQTPSRARFDELQRCGWTTGEIAYMYGCEKTAVLKALRKS
jgi:hypothetical protein